MREEAHASPQKETHGHRNVQYYSVSMPHFKRFYISARSHPSVRSWLRQIQGQVPSESTHLLPPHVPRVTPKPPRFPLETWLSPDVSIARENKT